MTELDQACNSCGNCYHPMIGPDTDGEPCDFCQDCGCPGDAHDRMSYMATDLTPEEGAAIDSIVSKMVAGVKATKVVKAEDVPPAPEPEPFDYEGLLAGAFDEIWSAGYDTGDDIAALKRFAEKVWDLAEEATADDISWCCGCSGSDKELNPFREA